MSARFEELESLLLDWENDALDVAGIARLREILTGDAEARSRFVQLQMLSAALQLEGDTKPEITSPEDVHSTPAPVQQTVERPVRRRRRLWPAGALSLMVCLLTAWIVGSHWLPDPVARVQPADRADALARDPANEATAQGVALVTRLVDVTWDPDQPPVEVGDALSPGRFAIQGGHAQVEFFCGATVVVEGPAELELTSATQARVHRGRLRAHVPPAARGFTLDADDLSVVDLGTQFGLWVTPDGANVQVFDGEVELHRASSPRQLLSAGEAVLRTADGRYEPSRAAPESFVDIASLESRAQRQRSARYERWSAWSAQLRRDPRVIAYYAFDRPGHWERRLACDNEPANSELDGAIVGAREVEGRWGAKGALEFKQPADRVRVQIPGEYGSLTLACWIRIDSLDRWYNSLFLTDGYDRGEPHWQIMDDGRIYFSVRPVGRNESGPRDYKALSPSFWKPTLNGQWIHLAVTCDLETNTITHYLNGQVLSRHVVPESQMPASTRIGTASIGNWALPTMPDAEFAIRNLNGSIDEFVILAAALNADEIREMYDNGRP